MPPYLRLMGLGALPEALEQLLHGLLADADACVADADAHELLPGVPACARPPERRRLAGSVDDDLPGRSELDRVRQDVGQHLKRTSQTLICMPVKAHQEVALPAFTAVVRDGWPGQEDWADLSK